MNAEEARWNWIPAWWASGSRTKPTRKPLGAFGHCRFVMDGTDLTYVFEDGSKSLLHVVSASDGVLVTDQRSAPKQERTTYRFGSDGRLHLQFDGNEAVFRPSRSSVHWREPLYAPRAMSRAGRLRGKPPADQSSSAGSLGRVGH